MFTNFQHKNIFFSKSQPLHFANFRLYYFVKCIHIKKKDYRSRLYAYVPLTVTLKSVFVPILDIMAIFYWTEKVTLSTSTLDLSSRAHPET